ncbi:MAG: HAMP domain-containing protein [Chloroflexi bacterium]|nr:HAMP domain-containing protein [Chloroflexota bacterium]
MRSWLSSLQFRLIMGFGLVLALALGSVSWWVSAEAERQAEEIRQLREEFRTARVGRIVSDFFADRKEWSGVQPTLEQAGSLYDWRILVQNAQGQVVGDSHGGVTFSVPGTPTNPRFIPVQNEGQEVGRLAVFPERPFFADADREPSASQLADTVNRSLLWTGLAAGGAGLLLVGLFSRRALAPVRQLTTAARSLGRGDLSQRVPASGNDEIGQLGRTFNAMASRLEDAERQRRSLMADVAHELRTPLSNIQGYVEAMRDGVMEPRHETLDTLHQQVAHLIRLVEDLRLLALAEAGALDLYREPHDVSDVLQSCAVAFQPRAEAASLSLRLEEAIRMPLVSMDRGRIEQVIHNLIENAILHGESGGRITLSVTAEGGRVARITVADTGAGIPGEDLPHIFDRLYRVDPSRARTTGGAGLGLTIAKQLIEAHGGRIWAESVIGEGSRFIIELPLTDPTETESEDRS